MEVTESRKVNYDALRSVFHKVAAELRSEGRTEARIGYPKIGCGLAGGIGR